MNDGLRLYGRLLPPLDPTKLPATPDWVQCDPHYIRQALKRALARPSGGWYVLDAARVINERPRKYQIEGRELVAYRANGTVVAAPNACPHIGGPLAEGRVRQGHLVCPWHGLALATSGHGPWRPYDTFDDGVLAWVRLGSAEEATPAPILPVRPKQFVAGVIRREAACEASGIIANRLDPWHGAHYHPHTFARLKVTEFDLDKLKVRVAYRLWRNHCIEVDATFHSPEPRSIVMTIVDGEGVGSVVETHSTPIRPGRSFVTEATLATSDRPGFHYALKVAFLIRPLIERAARRLWIEDVAYAERVYRLQTGLKD